jgi:hypothetical protein
MLKIGCEIKRCETPWGALSGLVWMLKKFYKHQYYQLLHVPLRIKSSTVENYGVNWAEYKRDNDERLKRVKKNIKLGIYPYHLLKQGKNKNERGREDTLLSPPSREDK